MNLDDILTTINHVVVNGDGLDQLFPTLSKLEAGFSWVCICLDDIQKSHEQDMHNGNELM